MNLILTPALWLLTIIVGLPQFSETVYTPALPDIAKSLGTSPEMVELTLTIYLFGFAIGTFLWGILSDFLGRKPCLLAGLLIYLAGCMGCLYSESIGMLLFSRLIQSLGGSTGSVLGQAICRDSFQGKRLGEVYASVGSALALSPAIGPILGGITDQMFGWSAIFILLVLMGLAVFLAVIWKLPETKLQQGMSLEMIKNVGKQMLLDKKLLKYGLIVAACNGILFSYYAEGSFYLIDLLQLRPAYYGLSFLALAIAGVLAGISTRKLYKSKTSDQILSLGSSLLLLGCLLFSVLTAWFHNNLFAILATVLCMVVIQFGSGMTLAVALARSLEDYRDAIGIASSLFGLFYYIVIAAITLGMGAIHSESLTTMPLYFLGIGLTIKWLTSWLAKQTVAAT